MESGAIGNGSAETWDGVERRRVWNCDTCAFIAKKLSARIEGGETNGSMLVDVLGTAAGIGLGLAVFYAIGLADAESLSVRALLGSVTVFWMVGMVRLGLSAK